MKHTSRALSSLPRSAQNDTQRVENIKPLPLKQKNKAEPFQPFPSRLPLGAIRRRGHRASLRSTPTLLDELLPSRLRRSKGRRPHRLPEIACRPSRGRVEGCNEKERGRERETNFSLSQLRATECFSEVFFFTDERTNIRFTFRCFFFFRRSKSAQPLRRLRENDCARQPIVAS